MSTLLKKHGFDTVYDSQKVFRLLLEAISNPLRIVNIKEYASKMLCSNAALLALAMTLLDNEASFCACGNHPLADEIASLTLAKREPLESADFIFISDPDEIENVIGNVKYGTLADPHKSATIVIQNDGEPDCLLGFYGPGIDKAKAALITTVAKHTISLRDTQSYGYPLGIDLIFVSSAGELFVIPRMVRVESEWRVESDEKDRN